MPQSRPIHGRALSDIYPFGVTKRCAAFTTSDSLRTHQKLLGHSNLSTTTDVYTHTSADADRSAALALEQAIFGDLFQTVPSFGNRNNTAATH
jgi:hypothetical protein